MARALFGVVAVSSHCKASVGALVLSKVEPGIGDGNIVNPGSWPTFISRLLQVYYEVGL